MGEDESLSHRANAIYTPTKKKRETLRAKSRPKIALTTEKAIWNGGFT